MATRWNSACDRDVQQRSPDIVGEYLQALHDGDKVEFVACARKTPQSHALETMVRLQVGKTHLDLLALVAGFGELGCTHQGARRIPCVFMHVAWDLWEAHVRSAFVFELT